MPTRDEAFSKLTFNEDDPLERPVYYTLVLGRGGINPHRLAKAFAALRVHLRSQGDSVGDGSRRHPIGDCYVDVRRRPAA
jgi:hypothetical protein